MARTSGGWTPALEQACRESWRPNEVRMAEYDGATIGWVQVRHAPTHDWLHLINLDPAVQGQGLGTVLLHRLMAEAQARGVPLWLSVYRANAARHLYARLGFAAHPRDDIRLYMVYPPDADGTPPAASG